MFLSVFVVIYALAHMLTHALVDVCAVFVSTAARLIFKLQAQSEV